jgi:hypothetical protein
MTQIIRSKPAIEVGQIRVFLMNSGLEIVGEIAEINKSWIFLIKPIVLNKTQATDGKVMLDATPILQGNPLLENDQCYVINGNLVLSIAKPNKKLIDIYRSLRSGLIVDSAAAKLT